MKKKKIRLIVWILILMSGGIFLENVRNTEEETLEHLKLQQQQKNLVGTEKEEEKKGISPQKLVDILDSAEDRTFFVQGDGEELTVVIQQCEMQSVREFREQLEKKQYRCYLKEGQGKMQWEEISLIVKD